jgi:hypothetical protein
VARFALTAALHVMQPLARLIGRLQHGLVPWRRRGPNRKLWRVRAQRSAWREASKSPESRLQALVDALRGSGAVVQRGGEFDDWDIAVRGGFAGEARLRLAVEEHGGGKQMLRFGFWPRVAASVVVIATLLAALGAAALAAGAVPVGALLLLAALGAAGSAAALAARALATIEGALPAAERDAVPAGTHVAAGLRSAQAPAASGAGWSETALPLEEATAKDS